MPSGSATERIRQLVQQTFSKLGTDASSEARETILIRDGHYCGRRFRRGGLEAVWFIEENQIKFHGKDGGIVKVLRPDRATLPQHQHVA